MSQNNPALRRQLALLLASSLCATASLPAVAAENGGAEMNGGAADASIATTANALPTNGEAKPEASLFDRPAIEVAGSSVQQLAANKPETPADPSQIPAASPLLVASSKGATAKAEKPAATGSASTKKTPAAPS